MASDLPTLRSAITARLTGDTGIGGLFDSTSIPAAPLLATPILDTWEGSIDDAMRRPPYIVYRIETGSNDSALRTRTWLRRVVLEVVCDKRPLDGSDGLAVSEGILRRVEGDWDQQAVGTAPTFGLDRWQPDITSSGWTADILHAVDERELHEPGYFRWQFTFDVRVSIRAA